MPNLLFIRGYVFALGIGTMQLSFALTQSTQLNSIYKVFFDWSDEDAVFWNTVLNCTAAIGFIIGSVFGSMVIAVGRRRSQLLI